MSKIYEALLRAEQDRAKQQQLKKSPAEEVHDAPPTPVEAPFTFEPAAHLQDLLSDKELASDETLPAESDAVESPTPLDIAAIKTTRWEPALQFLPALQERGNAVEQFRHLRSRMSELRDQNNVKSVLVTSGLPQEGKSYVAINLALSFARHKASKVLLIDGDMRRRTLHDILGCPSEPGLTSYLSGKTSAVEIMQRCRVEKEGESLPSWVTSLTFIAAGDESEQAADLSGNQRFAELIQAASPHFDWIVVDSSPVNLVTDGVNLGRACDGVLVIARAGVTAYESVQRALHELKATNVLGVVLNAVDTAPDLGGYYGYDSV